MGPDDNSGRLNLMTAQSRAAALARADWSRVFDLAVDYFIGLPSWAAAGDPRYQVWMTDTMPIKLPGATGSPIRPIGLALASSS